MPIETTPLYTCDSCDYTSADPFFFRILTGSVKVGNQSLVTAYDFKPEVLCIDCFCASFGIGTGMDHPEDTLKNDKRFKHVHIDYNGDDKNRDLDLDPPREDYND